MYIKLEWLYLKYLPVISIIKEIAMTIQKYFGDIALELRRVSERIKLGFSTHALSAGENRENIVGNFLKNYLPHAFGIDTGIILSTEGEFSNQADLVIVDHINNIGLLLN